MVITGSVTAHQVITRWRRENDESYSGLIPLVRPARSVAFGVRLPEDAERDENGLIAGALPYLGLVGDGYFLVDGPVGSWRAPVAKYFVSGSNLDVENQLLGSLETIPRTAEPRSLRWEQNSPFQAKWVYTAPAQASSSRRTTFISGVLLSLAVGFLVAFVQTVVASSSDTRT